MSQSAQPVSEYVLSAAGGPANPAFFATSDHVSYRVEIRDREMIHHEIMTDLEGRQIYCQSEPVHSVIGSGEQGHAFLIHRPGMLYVSPVNWYASSGSWGLAPGYNLNSHNRFERRVTDACINCHSGRVQDDLAAADRFIEPFFSEMSIGCERCHGAAADHVAFHSGEGPTDTIVNPSKLSPARRDAVCNQCHLQGVERILRVGRSEFDFRPGMLLNDVWSVFVRSAARSPDAAKAVSHAEQMQGSRCYQESSGLLGCTSCHDIHAPKSEKSLPDVYREKCLTCHSISSCSETQPRRSIANDSCIDCHMPSGSASDVPHAVHTSHLIVRRPETTTLLRTDSDTGKVALFPESDAIELSADEAVRSRGIALARLLDRGEQSESPANIEKLLREAKAAYPNDPAVCESLGLVLEKQGRTFEASVIWKAGLQADPTNESILFRLGRLCHDSGDLDAAADFLQKFLAKNPWHAAIHARYAHVLGLQGRLRDAIPFAEQAIQLDPTLIQVRGWLIEAYRATGQHALQAEQEDVYGRMLPITGLPSETEPRR
ncbi:MAG: cytochrome c3 family protein [Planctomycetota bacterium]